MRRIPVLIRVLLPLVVLGAVGGWLISRKGSGAQPPADVAAKSGQTPSAGSVAAAPADLGTEAAGSAAQVAPAPAAAAVLARFAYAQDWLGAQPAPLAAFRDWTLRYAAADAATRAALEPEGLALVRERRAALKALIARDPRAALAVTVPVAVRAILPAAIVAELETRFSVVGDYSVMAVDYGPEEIARRKQEGLETEPFPRFVQRDGRRVRAYVYGRRSGQTSKSDIPLHGIQIDDTAALHEGALRAAELDEPPPPGEVTAAGAAAGSATAVLGQAGGKWYRFASPEAFLQAEGRLEAAESGLGPRRMNSLDATVLGVDSQGGSDTAAAPATAWTTGNKKVLVVRIDFSDLPGEPKRGSTIYTPSYLQNVMDAKIAPYFAASSYGQTSLTTTVTTQVYRMPQTGAYYATNGDDLQLRLDTRTAVGATYMDSFDRVVLVFSSLGKSFNSASQITYGGLATVGDAYIWTNGEFDFRVVAHELGHTYGVLHANLWQVTDGNPVSNTGVSTEYGDDFDTMGSNMPDDVRTDFNPWFKNQFGWIADNQVRTVTGSGVYRINRFDAAAATGTLALKVVRGDTRVYWIGARRNFTDNASMQHGAYVVWGYGTNQASNLLDLTTPGNDDKDAALAIGSTLTDTTGNLSIRLVGEGGTAPAEFIDVEVKLGLNGAPIISASPQSRSFVAGETVVLAVTATGTPAPSYQWFKDGTLLSGATSATYTITGAQAAAAGSYNVRVSNTVATVFSDPAVLTFSTAPVITRQPVPLILAEGLSGSFSVTSEGTPAPAYQWRKDGQIISGATAATYTVTNAQAGLAGAYSVVVSNSVGSVVSDAATLTVKAASVPPSNDDFSQAWVLPGFAGTAKGSNTGATGETGEPNHINLNGTASSVWFKWTVPVSGTVQVDTIGSSFSAALAVYTGNALNSLTKIAEINGATKLSFTAAAGTTYYIAVGDGSSTHVGGSIVLNYLEAVPPDVTTQPVDQVGSIGGTAAFTVATSGAGPKYQWYHEGVLLAGATNATLQLTNLTLADAGKYYATVTTTGGTTVSATATLGGTAPAPTITTQPQALTAVAGQSVTFTVGASGTGTLSYQWRRRGTPILGATSNSLTISVPSRTDADFYDVVVGSGLSLTTSSRVQLAVAPTSYPTAVLVDRSRRVVLETNTATVNRIWPLSDGRAYVGGSFTSVNGGDYANLVRLNADGTVDTTFAPAGLDSTVSALAVQPDGKVIVGGNFLHAGGEARNAIVRLNTDGSVDPAFANQGFDGTVNALALQADGRVVVGGAFTHYTSSAAVVSPRATLARLNTDGSLDANFNPVANNSTMAIAVQGDQRIVVGGSFTTIAGQSRGYLARLNEDGTLDATYAVTGANDWVRTIVVQDGNAVLIGGAFTTYGGASAGRIARITATGALDSSPNFGAGFGTGAVYDLKVQADGQIVAAGSFTSYRGAAQFGLARLKTDGTADSTFNPSPDQPANTVALQGTKILAGGVFTQLGETNRSAVAQLTTSGAIDPSYAAVALRSGGTVSASLLLPGGKVLVGGSFTYANGVALTAPHLIRLNSDGTLDSSFNAGTGPNASVTALLLQPDGRVVVGGLFTTFNGSSRSRLARISSGGALDASAFSTTGSGPNGAVRKLSAAPDGRIVMMGSFTTVAGVPRNRIARLGPDGFLDYTFDPGAGATGSSPTLLALAVAPDGKVLLGGQFTAFSGVARNNLVRLLPNGAVDSAFQPPSTLSGSVGVRTLALQADGKPVVALNFSANLSGAFQRLLTDGSSDTSFQLRVSSMDGFVNDLVVQEDGRLLVIDSSTRIGVVPADGDIVRTNSDGTQDTTFSFQNIPDAISTLLMRDDGQLFLGGDFSVGAAFTQPAAAPTVATRPASQGVVAGGSATFSVVPGGTAPFTYQWFKDGVVIDGATSATYTIPTVTPNLAGNYTVKVSNAAGSVTSLPATLTVFAAGTGATHAVVGGGYVPGGTVTVTNRIAFSETLAALAFSVELPDGWSFVSSSGVGDVAPRAGDTEQAEWAWTMPPSGPVVFTYTLNVPPTASGTYTLPAFALLRKGGGSIQFAADPNPLVVGPKPRHSADLNADGAIDLADLTRLIELYNVRNGPVRTGCYSVDATGPDGFGLDAARDPSATLSLARYHSADTNHDGRIGLNELTRVIQIYNTREGSVRTGRYHYDASAESGFAPGP